MADGFEVIQARMEMPLAVLHLKGRIEHEAATELRNHCLRLAREGYTDLVINFSEVPFISSSGIGVLVMIADRYMRIDGEVQYACVPEPVMHVMNLLHIDRYLHFHETEESAIAATQSNA